MENKNEISAEVNVNSENGKIIFASEVIATIAGLAAADVKGVAGMSGGVVEGIGEMLGRKNLTKGVKVEVGTEETAVDVSVMIEYGYKIQDVCVEIQNKIKSTIETMTGLRVVEVNVYVQGVSFPQPTPVEEPKPEKKQEKAIEPPRVK